MTDYKKECNDIAIKYNWLYLNKTLLGFVGGDFGKHGTFTRYGIVQLIDTFYDIKTSYNYYIYINFNEETYSIVSFDNTTDKKEIVLTKLLSLFEMELLLKILMQNNSKFAEENMDMFLSSDTKFRVFENYAFNYYGYKKYETYF